MKRYRVNGKVIKVKPEHEQQFLQEYPNAILVEGNQQGVAQDATATLQTTASESQSGNTSSDLKLTERNLRKRRYEIEAEEAAMTNLLDSIKKAKSFKNEDRARLLSKEYNKIYEGYKPKVDSYQKDYNKYYTEVSKRKAQKNPDVPNEKNTWVEDALGKWWLTDFFSDYYRAAKSGIVQGESLGISLDYYEKGAKMSDEELMELVRKGRAMEEAGQTDEMLAFNNRYDEILKSSNDFMPGDDEGLSGFSASTLAFFRGWWENPTAMSQYSIQSLANMAYSAATNLDIVSGGAATGAATGAGIALVAGQLGPQIALPEELITVPGAALKGGIAGALATTSALMETGFTTAELVQELAKEEGLDWASMNDNQRIEWYKKIANDT